MQWISVKAGLPVEKYEVLTWGERWGCVMGYREKDGSWAATYKDYKSGNPRISDDGAVEYWMTLPPLPEGV
jgi:hypothetical protein